MLGINETGPHTPPFFANDQNNGKYSGQKCLFLPHPLFKNMRTVSLSSGKKIIRIMNSDQIFEYLVFTLAETIINGEKTENSRLFPVDYQQQFQPR